MKMFLTPSNHHRFAQPSSRRGVALVIVLSMLVLLSSVLIAFMLSASNERTAAQASSAQVTTRQIADSTVNLVLAQIRDATSQAGDDVTWASQPGAIQTFGGTLSNNKKTIQANGGPTGAFFYEYSPSAKDFVYKLYSADNLRPSATDYYKDDPKELKAEVEVIEKWDKNPTPDYVDLNLPYLSVRTDVDPSGLTVEPRYPIIDPRAKYSATEAKNTSDDPGIVDGFDAKITEDARLKLAGGTGNAVPYLPMPVKWLYVLKDGTVRSASNPATETNPMVGRTAFWTDDESCKLNVNTASEGTFWDTPSQSTEQESGLVNTASGSIASSATSLSLAVSQPARGEYQRYPGHPATTCLSPALGWLWDVPYSASTLATASILPNGNATYNAYKEAIYQITAFTPYGNGTTKGATGNTDPLSNSAVPVLNIATKHLFATVDEMMFTAKRTTGGAAGKSVANAAANAKFTPSALEKVRFFLSANSRSPELNLYSRPRVTIWPIAKNYDLRTPFDDLFAFTSTISKDPGGNEDKDKRYYLTREDAKSATKDYDGSAQNKQMYSYLQSLTSKAVPGFGGTFIAKYPSDRDQILTEIFDYMRTVNLVDTGTASRSGNVFVPYTPRYYPPGTLDQYTNRPARSVDWSGQVTPLKINGTMGMGRFPTITEAALIFHRVGTANPQNQMQAVLALEMATPMAGYPAIRETYYTKITAVKDKQLKIGVGATPVADADLCSIGSTPKKLINIPNVSSHEVCDGRGFMPNMGCTSSMVWFPEHKAPTDPTNVLYKGNPDMDPNRDKTFTATAKTFISTDPSNEDGKYSRKVTVKNYPYISKAFPIAAADKEFTFVGPELDVEIWSGESPDPKDTRSVLVQTIHLKFPAAPQKVPVPLSNGQISFDKRFDGSLGGSADTAVTGNDTVRSIELTGGTYTTVGAKGDMRLAMVLPDVPNTYFEPRDGPGMTGYGSTTNARVHGLTRGHGDAMFGNTGASPIAKGGTNNVKPPIIPKGIDGVVRSDGGPGDWDRGLSKHVNGALGNKVDEGNIKFAYGAGASQRSPYFLGRSIEDTGQTFFTPNRQLSSAIMFGSLPTGAKSLPPKPWQTLLFRPDRELSSTGHPGGKTSNGPTDHLMLDLFNLPVVEPYAISEPFSTAGKVNMNYVIAPFGYAKGEAGNVGTMKKPRSYIRRDTALRGVLKSTFLMAVPNTAADAGHSEDSINGAGKDNTYRFPIDLDKTIEEMEARLNDQSVSLTSRPTTLFRSASEICDIDLFPKGQTVNGSWGNYWDILNSQTGDNMRERPYAHIFPRLTTRSNVFTVHMRCQAIKKAPGGDPTKFDPVKDQVVGEYRGSSIIERFIDPNDPNLATYDETNAKVDAYYRYRIVATKQFSPR